MDGNDANVGWKFSMGNLDRILEGEFGGSFFWEIGMVRQCLSMCLWCCDVIGM